MKDGDSRPDSQPSLAKLYGLALTVQLLWALSNVNTKFAVSIFPGLLLTGLRISAAALLILPIYLLWKRPHAWTLAEAPKLLALGTIGVGVNQALFTVGITLTSVSHAALLIPITPLLTLMLSVLFLGETLTVRKVVGMVVAFSGVLVLQLTKHAERGATLFGDFLIFLGILTFAGFVVFGKKVTEKHEGIVVNTFGYVGAGIVFAPATWWLSRDFDFAAVPWQGWGSILYMALGSSIVGYLIYYWVLTHMEASRLVMFSYLQPVMTTTLAAVFLGEPVTTSLIVAGALVLLGVFIAERRA